MADEIGTSVIALDLDTTKFDKKMKSVDKSLSGKGGGKNAGILSSLGVKGMAPYMRFGKSGAYGGVSGIDVMSTIKGFLGGGNKGDMTTSDKEPSIALNPSGMSQRKQAARQVLANYASGGEGGLAKGLMNPAITGAARGMSGGAGLAASGGSGAGAGAAGAGAMAGAAAIPVVGAILAGVMIIKKIWNMIKNTQVFKYVKTIAQAAMGTLATVLALPFLIANKFKPFTDTLKAYFERIKSINDRTVAILKKLQDGQKVVNERQDNIIDKLKEGLLTLGQKLILFKFDVETFLTNITTGAKEGVTSFVDGIKNKMAIAAIDVKKKFAAGFGEVKNKVMGPEGLGGRLVGAGKELITKIQTSIDSVLSIPEKLFKMFNDKLLGPLARGIMGFVSTIATYFNNALHKISGGLLGSSEKPSD